MSDAAGSGEDWDTLLTVPARNFTASFVIYLRLDDSFDASRFEHTLLHRKVFEALEVGIDVARPPGWTQRQIIAALRYLDAGDYVLAWPLLATAVEGLYWHEAEEKGLIDPETQEILRDGQPTGQKARSAQDVFKAMPITERVRAVLNRYAFGSEANAFRHGRRGPWDERQQCAILLLALIAWLDGAGWRHFDSSKLS
jgi:hypothetical protein